MNKDDKISEEQLNAFLDGELESEEMGCLFNEAERSEELDQRLCKQRKLKEFVQHAYRDVPEPKRLLAGHRSRTGWVGLSLAASLLLFLGVSAGLFLRGALDPGPNPGGLVTANNLQAIDNYILHIISGEPEQMRLALQKAEQLLASAEPETPRQVEIVANDRGLNFLRSDITPFSKEISNLAKKKVVFYACSKAIQRLEESGVAVQLVPEAIPGYTALDRVVIRMKDGWQYIKI